MTKIGSFECRASSASLEQAENRSSDRSLGRFKHRARDLLHGYKQGGRDYGHHSSMAQSDLEAEIKKLETEWNRGSKNGSDESGGQPRSNEGAYLIAESTGHFRQNPHSTIQTLRDGNFTTEKIEQIAKIIVDGVERSLAGQISGGKIDLQLALDHSRFGLSGISISLTANAFTVVLEGLSDPGSIALANAAQSLVRELQKSFPNRSVQIKGRSAIDEGEVGSESDTTLEKDRWCPFRPCGT